MMNLIFKQKNSFKYITVIVHLLYQCNQKHHLSAPVVGLGEGVELLLAGGVPQHQAHLGPGMEFVFLEIWPGIDFDFLEIGPGMEFVFLEIGSGILILNFWNLFRKVTSSLCTLSCFSKKSTPMVFL